MGLIDAAAGVLFGSGRNVIKETAEIFLENAEASAQRDSEWQNAALKQFAAEFALPRRGLFDRFMDALNRVPRPALALGTLGLFVAAMADPIWFATRMQGISLVPQPLWWLMGAIVSFYFGARQQLKGQEFQQELARTMAQTGAAMRNIDTLEAMRDGDEEQNMRNPALDAWRDGQ